MDSCANPNTLDENSTNKPVTFMNKVSIRIATVEDSTAIAHVHVETWQDAYRGIVADKFLANIGVDKRAAMWLERLTAETERRPLVFVAEDVGEIVGFVGGGKTRQPHLPFDAELYAFYVKPGRQRESIGRELTSALVGALIERKFSGLIVGVLEENRPGRRFYESIGGKLVGSQSLTIGDESHSEVFYGWTAIDSVGSQVAESDGSQH